MDRTEFDQLIHILKTKGKAAPADVLEKLEPYKAKRAIFLAAGFGSRMMVTVNGVRIIETLIKACIEADIEEIYIVRGYLAREFDKLLDDYPMIKFIDNADFDKANNISSVFMARELLQNAYVLEADLYLSNPAIIRPYNYESNVLGIWKDHTDDWCLMPDSNGYVLEEKTSGDNTYQMVGIYYWNTEDGERLAKHIELVYQTPEGKDRYWETIPNQTYRGEYKIKIIPCIQSDIVEIDTYDELKAIDSSYS